MTEGKGHLSTDEILGKTGGQAGQHTEVGPDGKTYTYSVEVEEVRPAYLWGILGQWDILLLNLTSIGFKIFIRCLIFDLSFFTNADVVTIKDETSKENL